jgi:hypothetical protein
MVLTAPGQGSPGTQIGAAGQVRSGLSPGGNRIRTIGPALAKGSFGPIRVTNSFYHALPLTERKSDEGDVEFPGCGFAQLQPSRECV